MFRTVLVPDKLLALASILLVRRPQQELQDEHGKNTCRSKGKRITVSSGISRGLAIYVNVTSNDSTDIAGTDQVTNANGTFGGASRVGNIPGVNTREDWIHAGTGKANGKVAERDVAGNLGRLGEQDGESNDQTHLRADDEGHAPAALVREDRDDVRRHGAAGVGGNGQELGVGRGEAHGLYNGRHSELHGVVGHGVGPAAEDQEVHLPVTNDGEERVLMEVALVTLGGGRSLLLSRGLA